MPAANGSGWRSPSRTPRSFAIAPRPANAARAGRRSAKTARGTPPRDVGRVADGPPGASPMAAKLLACASTSLSKVFGAIARFSEDVDITLDYRGLDGSFGPFAEGVSRNRLKKFSEDLKSFVRDHAHGVVAPHFQKTLAAEFDAGAFQLEVSDDGEQLRVHYPTVLETPEDYVGNSVLIEFGGRNITEPNEEHEVRP